MTPFKTQWQDDQGLPSAQDWMRLQPEIQELYLDRQCSIEQLSEHLKRLGFHRVNERMVRARITQWNLQKNNRLPDMLAALCLLDPDPAQWPSPNPRFRVREREVSLDEVLRFFRRKRIQHPFEHARSAQCDRKGQHVVLLDSAAAPPPSNTSTALVDTLSSSSSPPLASSSRSGRHSLPLSGHPSQVLHRRTRKRNQHGYRRESLPMSILITEQVVVAHFRHYCTAYVCLGLAETHPKPAVHRDTIHQRFADRVTEGIARLAQQSPDAVSILNSGYDLVLPLLRNCHPMALARYLTVVCHLAAQGADYTPILTSLLLFTASMATELAIRGPLAGFLSALSSTAPHLLLETAVSSLRVAVAIFSDRNPNTWHGRYIQARLCDCFYYGQSPSETAAHRALLLRDLEAFHGPWARTVIWTMTRVGDDHLDAGDIDSGEQYHVRARARAEWLAEGFGKAEMRFAALQGLARAEQMRFECLHRPGSSSASYRNNAIAATSLQNAHRLLDDALSEGKVWFDQSSHRVARVKEQREQVGTVLKSLGYLGLSLNSTGAITSLSDDCGLSA